MSKPYICIDCGKKFRFDYTGLGIPFKEDDTEEEFEQKIKEYNKQIGIPVRINICGNCLKPLKKLKDSLMNKKKDEINTVEKTSKIYINKLKEKFDKEDEDLKKYSVEEEEKKKKELEEMKKLVEKNEDNLKMLLKEIEKTEQNEQNLCDEFRNLEMNVYEVEKELSKSNDIKLDYECKIKSFSNSNIFTELFQISFNGKYGEINACYFKDPHVTDNWNYINGGWGYIILLTKLLSIKYKFESIKYDLIPIGNYSKIIDKQKKIEYEMTLCDLKSKERFNSGMVAYLVYLDEFLNYLSKEGKIKNKNDDICPKIVGDKINNKTIKIEYGKERIEDWYQAMKYLLTILKYLIYQVMIDENEAFKNTMDNIDIINNTKPTNKIEEIKP